MKELTRIEKKREVVSRVETLDWDQEFSIRETYEELGFSRIDKAMEAVERELDKDEYLPTEWKTSLKGGRPKKDYTMKLKPYMKLVASIQTSEGKRFRKELVDVYQRVVQMKQSGVSIITMSDLNLIKTTIVDEISSIGSEINSINRGMKLIRKDSNKRDKDVLRDMIKESNKRMYEYYGHREDYTKIVNAINVRISGMTSSFSKKQFDMSPRDYDYKYNPERLNRYLKYQDVLNTLNRVFAMSDTDKIVNAIEKFDD